MEFKKLSNDENLLRSGEWRLASVDEVKSYFEEIKSKGILQQWSILRLSDGWVTGYGYGYELKKGNKSDMGEMLVVKNNNRSGAASQLGQHSNLQLTQPANGVTQPANRGACDLCGETAKDLLARLREQEHLNRDLVTRVSLLEHTEHTEQATVNIQNIEQSIQNIQQSIQNIEIRQQNIEKQIGGINNVGANKGVINNGDNNVQASGKTDYGSSSWMELFE